jgi:RNA polymerase sigma-54 factor
MNAPVIQHEQRQQQTLTPRLQQAVRLLQLSSLDFAQEMQQAMSSNPFLEPEEPEADDAPATPETASADDEHSGFQVETDSHRPSEQPWEGEGWSAHGGTRRNGEADPDFELSEITAAVETLRGHLHSQLQLLATSPRDRLLMTTIVEAIDDDGYLRIGLDELQAIPGLDPMPDDDEMQVALKLVQSLDPAGVGARDLRECLLLQLKECDATTAEDLPDVARRIVTDHLDKLATRDSAGLSVALDLPEPVVARAFEFIRHLDPRPGWRFGAANTRYVTPDVIARKVRDRWTVVLNPSVVPRVRLNRMYAELFKSHRDSSHKDLAAQLQEARWTVRNVEQRFATIQRVAEAIVRRQHQFFDYGELAMKPLALREVADELGLHESTVSRVTNNKYMAMPAGVFELKYFFSRALATSSGGRCSATAIRGAIKDMIEAENPVEPLSDAHIARLLARQGLQVARRTVTKYRQMMRVPAYEMRRRSASSAEAAAE